MIRVLIADDHAVVRDGLGLLLSGNDQIEVVAMAANGREAVEQAEALNPDVVLMDLSMPELDGVRATRLICDRDPNTSVVVLTTFADSRRVMDSLEAGAVGYLMKDSSPQDIITGVITAANGGSPLDPRVARSLVDAQRGGSRSQRDVVLTKKQTEVVALVAEGLSNRLIARRLQISEKTVKAHLTAVYNALGVTDRVQAALWAQRFLEPQ